MWTSQVLKQHMLRFAVRILLTCHCFCQLRTQHTIPCAWLGLASVGNQEYRACWLGLTKCNARHDYYDAYRTRKIEDGVWDHSHDEDFAVFANDIDRVTIALPTEDLSTTTTTSNANSFDAWTPPWEKDASIGAAKGKTADPSHCWRHQFSGDCKYGDQCKNKHVGGPGARKSEVTDEDGYCLLYKSIGECKRRDCPFKHPPEVYNINSSRSKPKVKELRSNPDWSDY